MVFESVVVDVLNRFLGDYVVNLDSSQLSLGIWGGKVLTVSQCLGVKTCNCYQTLQLFPRAHGSMFIESQR